MARSSHLPSLGPSLTLAGPGSICSDNRGAEKGRAGQRCLAQPGQAQRQGPHSPSRPVHPSDPISGRGPGMHLGFTMHGPQPKTGSWESSPDERGRINCPPVSAIPAMGFLLESSLKQKEASTQGPSCPCHPQIPQGQPSHALRSTEVDLLPTPNSSQGAFALAGSPAFRCWLTDPERFFSPHAFICITRALCLPNRAGGAPEMPRASLSSSENGRVSVPKKACHRHILPSRAEGHAGLALGQWLLKAGQWSELALLPPPHPLPSPALAQELLGTLA